MSCASAHVCTAVGDYFNRAGTLVTLAERWNGTKWVIQNSPNPAHASDSIPRAVSCTSAEVCIAVGIYINTADTVVPFAERRS